MKQDRNTHVDAGETVGAKALSGLRGAGRLAALHAARMELATVTLPSAYAALGRCVLTNTEMQGVFRDDIKACLELQAKAEQIKANAGAPIAGATFVDKARHAAQGAKALAQRKATELKLFNALRELGGKAHARLGSSAGPAEEVGVIVRALQRQEELLKQLTAIRDGDKGNWLGPKKMAYAAGGAALLVVCVGLTRTHGPLKQQAKQGAITAATPRSDASSRVDGTIKTVGEERSWQYEEGKREAIAFCENWNRSIMTDAGRMEVRAKVFAELMKWKENLKMQRRFGNSTDSAEGRIAGYEYGLRHIIVDK